jgi:hypothetical protein
MLSFHRQDNARHGLNDDRLRRRIGGAPSPILMRSIGPLLASALIPAGVLAQDPNAEPLRKALAETPANTFRYVGKHLVCKQETPAQNYLACLRIGPYRIGDSYRPIRERLPKPYREVALDGGVIASAYRIAAPGNAHAYWIIGHRNDAIVSIQLTGNYSHPDLAFATIRLNDSEERVLALLGPRAQITAVREIGGFLWDYRPFPISIEFVQGKVYSIKVATPDSR